MEEYLINYAKSIVEHYTRENNTGNIGNCTNPIMFLCNVHTNSEYRVVKDCRLNHRLHILHNSIP